MPELTPEQKKALEEQKKQCPFCRIIAGEIPAKVAYEDNQITAILDINPLSDGHSLLLPKEHYPIMPLITQKDFVQLFRVVKDYSFAQKRALLKTGVTVFIANGAAAGQISPHFMIHLIPREDGDGIGLFRVEGDEAEPDPGIEAAMRNRLQPLVEGHLARHPEAWHKKKEITYTKEQIIAIIDKNPQLKEMVSKDPEGFSNLAETNPQLKEIFSKVDVSEIISHFRGNKYNRRGEGPKSSGREGPEDQDPDTAKDGIAGRGISEGKQESQESKAEETEDKSTEEEEEAAPDHEEVLEILKANPKALELIKKAPEEFIAKAQANTELQKLFRGVDIHRIIAQLNPGYKRPEGNKENKRKEKEETDRRDTKRKEEKEKGRREEEEGKPSLDDITDLL